MNIKPLVKMELVGRDGNAFSLLGAFQREARKQNVDPTWIQAVIAEAMTGDYDHLLATLIKATISPAEEESEEDEWTQLELQSYEEDEE